ncbi:DNA-binding protein, partial [[Kitasatospora] papulosa]
CSGARRDDWVAQSGGWVRPVVADRPPWRVGDLDHLVPDPAAALHALLVHGLVRPAGAHLPGRFTALQLVRLLHLRDRPPAAARAC